jgi:hypothetical protein
LYFAFTFKEAFFTLFAFLFLEFKEAFLHYLHFSFLTCPLFTLFAFNLPFNCHINPKASPNLGTSYSTGGLSYSCVLGPTAPDQ